MNDEILSGRHGPCEQTPEPNLWGLLAAILFIAALIVGFLYCPDLTWLFE